MCNIITKPKSKYKHFKSNAYKEFDRCEHLELTIEKPNINNVDEVFYAYIIEHNKQYDYYLIKRHFIFFSDNQYSTDVKSNLFDNKTMISWQNFLKKVIDDFKNKRYNFNHIEEMNNIISNKMNMTYDFYIEHDMHAFE